MSRVDPVDTGDEFARFSRDECLRLLAGGAFGRVVFTQGGLPAAQPVSYVLDGDEILFRAAGGSDLAAASRQAVVAFQVDEIDPSTSTGWTVVGVGEAYEVRDVVRLSELAGAGSTPWINGDDYRLVAIRCNSSPEAAYRLHPPRSRRSIHASRGAGEDTRQAFRRQCRS